MFGLNSVWIIQLFGLNSVRIIQLFGLFKCSDYPNVRIIQLFGLSNCSDFSIVRIIKLFGLSNRSDYTHKLLLVLMIHHVIPQILFRSEFLSTNLTNKRNVQMRVDVIQKSITLREFLSTTRQKSFRLMAFSVV